MTIIFRTSVMLGHFNHFALKIPVPPEPGRATVVSPVTPANFQIESEMKSRNNGPELTACRDSLLANLRCRQSRVSIQGEKIGSLLAELQSITSLRDHQELER